MTTLRQASFDLRLLLRNGEQLLLTLIIPVVLLIGLTLAPIVSLQVPDGVPRINAALAGVLAVAVLSSAFTSLAIGIGFDRRSGALQLLATTPLSRAGILSARALATLAMVLAQTILLLAVALALGWAPAAIGGSLCFVVLGTISLGTCGLALGGWARAEATLAIANGIFVLLLLAGGTALPTSTLPPPVATVVGWLPTAALGDALRTLMGSASGNLLRDAAILACWGVIGSVVALRTFRWD